MIDIKGMVIKKMRRALFNLCEENGINIANIRIKIFRQDGLKLEVLDGTSKVKDTTVREAIPFKGAEKLMGLPATVENSMIKSLLDLSSAYKIDESSINVRMYLKPPNGMPAMHLFNGGTPICALKEDQVINI